MQRFRTAALLVAGGAILASGCSGASGEPGDTQETPFVMPTPREDAVARAEAGAEPTTMHSVAHDTPYVVHAACEGTKTMTYLLYVNDEERASREFSCGQEVRHTAFLSIGGESVRVELRESSEGTGFVEIVPYQEN